ncbi:hypothetical protein F5148DRAFT_1232641 [Russula earlei]|uniref:Uncharacterized protein n=1 Tax=Russula earlei TaxID=71964 RepID=A0ACC0TYL8_9AGAM|nr:hypothetical protein F5148DRAFT_1232641 [Russula earlei]
MHISAVLAFVCLAVGVAPSFSLPSSSNRGDPRWGHNERAERQRDELLRNTQANDGHSNTQAGHDQSMPTNVAPLPSISVRGDPRWGYNDRAELQRTSLLRNTSGDNVPGPASGREPGQAGPK